MNRFIIGCVQFSQETLYGRQNHAQKHLFLSLIARFGMVK